MSQLFQFIRRILRSCIPPSSRAALGRLLNPSVATTAKLHRREDIHIAPGVIIDHYCVIRTDGGKVVLGENTLLGAFCVVIGTGNVNIGRDVMVGPHTIFAAGNHDYTKKGSPMREYPVVSSGPITVEDDVWIGANCVICDGVTIATGSVIGAGAVVTRSTEPNGVYAGVPAKRIRGRFDSQGDGEKLLGK